MLARIRTVTGAHKQIRSFRVGLVTDFFADRTTKYPAACLQYSVGSIGGSAKQISFRLFIVDLVNVSDDTKSNEDDVFSDTLEIIMDLVAELSQPAFNDWIFSVTSNVQSVSENDNDLNAGWYIDFSVRVPFTRNICAVPSDLFIIPGSGSTAPGISPDMKVYDKEYIASGSEGTTIDTSVLIPDVTGKKILVIIREGETIYKVSSAPDSVEYTWDNTTLVLGKATTPGERFLILYRNY